MSSFKYKIIRTKPRLIIKDMNGGVSLTNCMEEVVQELLRKNLIPRNCVFDYIDSIGSMDSVIVMGGKFQEFIVSGKDYND